MTEAEGVNLQVFRLTEIKKVAQNIEELRKQRDEHKKAYEEKATKLLSLN